MILNGMQIIAHPNLPKTVKEPALVRSTTFPYRDLVLGVKEKPNTSLYIVGNRVAYCTPETLDFLRRTR